MSKRTAADILDNLPECEEDEYGQCAVCGGGDVCRDCAESTLADALEAVQASPAIVLGGLAVLAAAVLLWAAAAVDTITFDDGEG